MPSGSFLVEVISLLVHVEWHRNGGVRESGVVTGRSGGWEPVPGVQSTGRNHIVRVTSGVSKMLQESPKVVHPNTLRSTDHVSGYVMYW